MLKVAKPMQVGWKRIELGKALLSAAKTADEDKLREMLKAKIVNIEAKSPDTVSNATKLIAIYIIRTVFKRRWFVARRSKRR